MPDISKGHSPIFPKVGNPGRKNDANLCHIHALKKKFELNIEQIHTTNSFSTSFPSRKIQTNIEFGDCQTAETLLKIFCLLRNRTRLSLIHPVFVFVALNYEARGQI